MTTPSIEWREDDKVEEHRWPNTVEGHRPLPNGCTLYWKDDDGYGRRYYTDEVGGGCTVWFTSLVDQSTMLAAMAMEAELVTLERYAYLRMAEWMRGWQNMFELA